MNRLMSVVCGALVTVGTLAVTATAHADGSSSDVGDAGNAAAARALAPTVRLDTYLQPPDPEVARLGGPHATLTGQRIYMNRCVGSCTVKVGSDSAVLDSSPFIDSPATLAEYAWKPGEWDAIVKCVQEVYSPFAVTVTDVRPTSGQYSGVMVAGSAGDMGKDASIGGFAAVAQDCSPFPHGLAFSFPALIDAFAQSTGSRVTAMCWIIAQETAHDLGLDHELTFAEGNTEGGADKSACNDPMTYNTDCGGQKFFRDKDAVCGDTMGPRACRCGPTQNSHQKLLAVLGAGTTTIVPPTASMVIPAASGMPLGAVFAANAESQRGVDKIELVINGDVVQTQAGAAFKLRGQTRPSTYQFDVPATLPSSLLDISVRAYDDLGVMTESPKVTIYKGAAGGCTAATSCNSGQVCDAGYCVKAPPAEVGAACVDAAGCASGMCIGTVGEQICSQDCTVSDPNSCPADLACTVPNNSTDPAHGVCFTPAPDGGGCCSVDGASSAASGLALAGLLGLGFLVAPRRRRRS